MYDILVPQEFFAYALVFARVGAVLMQMPAIGETYISPRIRLMFGMMLTLIVTPVVRDGLPAMPDSILLILLLLLAEILIGVFIGSIMRIVILTMATTGAVMSFVSGFAAAQAFNPMLQGQGALHTVVLTLTATAVILATDTHHLLIMATVDSYQLFNPGEVPILEDFSQTIARTVARSFVVGVQFASPFLLGAIIYNSLLGLLARLMPNLQIFFVAMPLQILLGIILFALIISSVILWFMRYFTETIAPFVVVS
ncbi:flagellar biosynthetic protein FliR [Curvivirga sp.]|uniref:flagellar biosynthetic protein FliR n=1 Tax=Curvivirga sp. TaxID=2856848 RepID=UPI003B5C21A7